MKRAGTYYIYMIIYVFIGPDSKATGHYIDADKPQNYTCQMT